jgi:hypothetical protein
MNTHARPLPGLDGSNSLAFLASLGVLRLLSLARPDWNPKLGWNKATQRPVLSLLDAASSEDISLTLWSALIGGSSDNIAGLKARELLTSRQTQRDNNEKELKKNKKLTNAERKGRLEAIDAELAELQCRWLDHAAPHLNLGPDTKFLAIDYRTWEQASVRDAGAHRAYADTLSALCSSAIVDDEGFAADTDFRTVRGAGHQHFLGIMVNQLLELKPAHLHKTLFAPWQYDDPLEALSLRWDPLDDVRYALRWDNPSGDLLRKRQGNMIAGNALAAAALPLYPVMPREHGLATVGFSRLNRATCWTWPLWEGNLDLNSVRSLLAHHTLQNARPSRRKLNAMGVFESFRCERFTQGKFRNFTPAASV